MRKLLGISVLLMGTSVMALANQSPWPLWPPVPNPGHRVAPEISADQAGSALALVAGVLLSVRGRRKKS